MGRVEGFCFIVLVGSQCFLVLTGLFLGSEAWLMRGSWAGSDWCGGGVVAESGGREAGDGGA